MPEQWVKDLTEGIIGGPPVQIGNYYQHPEDGLIYIESGQYWGRHGLSNFWRWRVVGTNEKKHGYAGKWPVAEAPEEES